MKFNKVAACLLATACTASLFGAMTSVSAAGDLTIKAGTKSVEAGSEFTIDIELAGVPSTGIAGLDFAVKYDPAVFEVTGVTEGAVSKTGDKQVGDGKSSLDTALSTGAVAVLWSQSKLESGDTWIKQDGVVLTLNCKAKADGTSKVEITKGLRATATGVDVAVEGLKVVNPVVSAGTVTVGKTAVTDPTTVPTGTTGAKLLGDVNLDGKIDITDLSVLAIKLVDKKELTGDAKANADVTKDGIVNLQDLATLRQFISKVITEF